MFQQLLANKHPRLRDSVPIVIWPRGGLGLVTDKKTKKKKKFRAEQEPRSAHGRAVNKSRHHILHYYWLLNMGKNNRRTLIGTAERRPWPLNRDYRLKGVLFTILYFYTDNSFGDLVTGRLKGSDCSYVG